jgi:sarcosine oxidase subunit delta
MKIMTCPLNGARNISEFSCFGEVGEMPDPRSTGDKDWAEYVWYSNNTAGVVREWWCHTATSYWFIAERNTVSDEIIATYPADRVFDRRVDSPPKEPAA